MNKNLSLFKSEIANLIFFWLFGVTFFLIFRISFILIYHNDISENVFVIDYFKAIFMGIRFDMTVVSYFMLIPLLTTLTMSNLKKGKVVIFTRKFFQSIFIVLSCLISIITYNYYFEYQDQFNHFLFMGLYDDKKAVFDSIIADFNPIMNASIIIIITIISFKILHFFEDRRTIYSKISKLSFKHNNVFIGFIALLLFIASIRGSLSEYPVRRFYASVTSDAFLNKTIINPFRSLNYAISDYNELNKNYDVNPFGKIDNINSKKSITNLIKQKNDSIDMSKTPDHIFIVILESYDSWPLLEDYKELNISNNLREIQGKGIRFTNFLPSANSTMNSVASLISGVPYSGVNISNIGSIRAFPSSIFKQFEKIGYETNFFYGGYLSWQKIGDFSKMQGAKNIYGAGSSKGKKGIWGIDDESLYEMVLNKVSSQKKSLTVILTMSYHPPYEVDIYSKGFEYKKVTDLPLDIQEIYNEKKMSLKALGHLWYSDKALGNFVRKAEQKYKNSLFNFTGDHFGRRFINGTPTLYENSSVPFIIYSNYIKLQPQKISTPGSHIDITPTILNLTSDQEFYSFGKSLFNSNKNIGFGYNKVIDKDVLQKFSKNFGYQEFNTKTKKNTSIKTSILKRKHDSLMRFSWHYTVKGDTIH